MSQEMPVVDIHNAESTAEVVFVCEHASNHIPERYGALGLDDAALESHIAWDPGALEVALSLAGHFAAPLVAARVSRLVYDCNRPPEAPDAVPARSEDTSIPGNTGISESERRARATLVYEPFSNALAGLLDRREREALSSALITVHSFTPVYRGKARSVELGILHDSDSRLADALLEQAASVTGLNCVRNAPYGPADGVTHSLQRHGLARGLPNVMLEIRNDLLRDQAQRADIAARLARLIELSLPALLKSSPL